MKNLYSASNYQEIISLWEKTDEREQFTEWDYVYVMNAFYAQKNYDQCLEVLSLKGNRISEISSP